MRGAGSAVWLLLGHVVWPGSLCLSDASRLADRLAMSTSSRFAQSMAGWPWSACLVLGVPVPRQRGEPLVVGEFSRMVSASVSCTARSAPAVPNIQAHTTTQMNTTIGLRLNSAPWMIGCRTLSWNRFTAV